MSRTIKCEKDLFNNGKCFSKGETYQTNREVYNPSDLIDSHATNDLGENHLIGMWYKYFKIK